MRDFDPDLDDGALSPEEEAELHAEDARRQGREDRERQRAAYEASRVVAEARQNERAAARSKKIRLAIGVLLAAGLAGAIGFAVLKGFEGQENAQARVAKVAEPLIQAGFRLERSLPSQKGRPFTSKTAVDGCAAFVAAEGETPVSVKVTRSSGGTVVGKRVVVCSCGAEDLDVTVPDAKPEATSGTFVLGVLRGTAAQTGGVRVLREAGLPDVALGEVAGPCEAEQLDAWLQKAQPKVPDGKPSAEVEAWTKRGFGIVSSGAVGKTWAVAPAPENGCLVTVPEDDGAVLRANGVEVTRGAAVCFAKALPVTLHKPSGSALTLLTRTGVSALELYEAVGATPRRHAYLFEDAWKAEAAKMLTDSGTNPREITSPDKVPKAEKHRLLAVLRVPDESVKKDQPLRGLACSPKNPDDLLAPLAVCILPRDTDAPVLRTKNYVAVSPLPPFLAALTEAKDERLLAAMGDFLVLTRRLARRGLEPTLLESVKETGGGAEVTGRAGDKDVCAVTLMPTPPFVVPLSADGKPWSVLSEPRIFPITPAKHLQLTGPVSGPPTARRTIVFRAHEAGK